MKIKIQLINNNAHQKDTTKSIVSEDIGIKYSHRIYEKLKAVLLEEIKSMKEELVYEENKIKRRY